MRGGVVPHPQLNIRIDPRTEAMLALLRHHFNLSNAAVIRLALVELIRARGLEVPDGPPEGFEVPDDDA
jgi:hypothetical protein